MGLVYVIASIAIALIAGLFWGQLQVRRARRQGIYPAKGKATMEDVRRLALHGDTGLAMRAYREIHRVTPKEAKRAVERMVSPGGKTES